jgi:hypothetical protein
MGCHPPTWFMVILRFMALMLCTVGPTHLATASPAGAPAGCCGNNVSDSRLNRRNALTALGSGKLQQNDARMNSVSKNIESLPGPDKEANQPGNRHRLPPPCSEGAYYSRSLALALSLSLSLHSRTLTPSFFISSHFSRLCRLPASVVLLRSCRATATPGSRALSLALTHIQSTITLFPCLITLPLPFISFPSLPLPSPCYFVRSCRVAV